MKRNTSLPSSLLQLRFYLLFRINFRSPSLSRISMYLRIHLLPVQRVACYANRIRLWEGKCKRRGVKKVGVLPPQAVVLGAAERAVCWREGERSRGCHTVCFGGERKLRCDVLIK